MPARGSSAGPTRHHRTNCPPNVVGPLRPQGTTAARQWRPNRARKTRSRHKPWPSRRGTTQDAHYRVCLSSVHGCRFSGPFPIASRFLTAARCPPQPVTLLPESTMSGPQSSNDDGPPATLPPLSTSFASRPLLRMLLRNPLRPIRPRSSRPPVAPMPAGEVSGPQSALRVRPRHMSPVRRLPGAGTASARLQTDSSKSETCRSPNAWFMVN